MKGAKYSIGIGPNKITLAKWCPECGGDKYIADATTGTNAVCGYCEGFGSIMTEDGSTILALVNDILIKGRVKK